MENNQIEMKRITRLLFIVFLVATSFRAYTQTALPTSWDCAPATLPNGWTTNITSYYTAAAYVHTAPNAAKFDATGTYLTINFVDDPDTLIYYLRGAYFSGGLFTIQQSANGMAWDSVKTFTNANIPNASLASAASFKNRLAANSRFVRFYYTNKSSGNVDVDDITITKRPPQPEANMKIKLNDVLIPNGTTAVVGNVVASTFKVLNAGTDSVLRLTASNFSGLDAAMFGVSSIPVNVQPLDSATFTINFAASGADGTKTATIAIQNNDADNSPYVMNLWAVKGCCATQPTHAATNVAISNVKSYTFRVDFADGASVPDQYIVLKKSSPITEEPLNGHTYLKGDFIGGAQVCYVGHAGYFSPANVVANTHYYIKVFPVNGASGYESYYTATVASGDTSTLPNMIGSYYSAINIYSPTLWQDLHNLVNVHTNLFYSDYIYYLINEFESRDTVAGGQSKKVLTCAYSGENYVYTPPFAFTVYSREHVFCESWMPTYNDANYTSLPDYSDYHNLLPVNQNKINVYRLNYPLGKVLTVQYQYLNGKKGLDSLGHVVFEPRDQIKGDAARAMFYQVLCYDGVGGNDWFLPQIIDTSSIPYGQNEQLMKKWSLQDPPDAYEIARNDYIYSIQGNRNLFIDHPEWVDWLGFDVLSDVSTRTAIDQNIWVYPNPTSGNLTIGGANLSDARFELYNRNGSMIITMPMAWNTATLNCDMQGISPGLYFYKVISGGRVVKTAKLVVMPH